MWAASNAATAPGRATALLWLRHPRRRRGRRWDAVGCMTRGGIVLSAAREGAGDGRREGILEGTGVYHVIGPRDVLVCNIALKRRCIARVTLRYRP